MYSVIMCLRDTPGEPSCVKVLDATTLEVSRQLHSPGKTEVRDVCRFRCGTIVDHHPKDVHAVHVAPIIECVEDGKNACVLYAGPTSELPFVTDSFEFGFTAALNTLLSRACSVVLSLVAYSCSDSSTTDVIRGVPTHEGQSTSVVIVSDCDARRYLRCVRDARNSSVVQRSHLVATLRTDKAKLCIVRFASTDAATAQNRAGKDLYCLEAAAAHFSGGSGTADCVALRQSRLLYTLRDVLHTGACGLFVFHGERGESAFTRTSKTCRYLHKLHESLQRGPRTIARSRNHSLAVCTLEPELRTSAPAPVPSVESHGVLPCTENDHEDGMDLGPVDVEAIQRLLEEERQRADGLQDLIGVLREDTAKTVRDQCEELQVALRSQALQTATLQIELEQVHAQLRRAQSQHATQSSETKTAADIIQQLLRAEVASLKEELLAEKRRSAEAQEEVARQKARADTLHVNLEESIYRAKLDSAPPSAPVRAAISNDVYRVHRERESLVEEISSIMHDIERI